MPHDLQLWCEDCQVGYEGDCTHHGPLTRVRDTEVDTRARRSIPNILQLRDQQDFIGVYAREHLDKRLQFGPLHAVKVLDGSDKGTEAAQQITARGGLVVWVSEATGERWLLDTRHEERTNWMCFVRAAHHRQQQNVVAFQYRGQIYFVTIKEIPAESELRVWYSKDYAERMGTTLLSAERLSWQFRTRERFRCAGCSVVFSSTSSLANHRCNGGNGSKPVEVSSAIVIKTAVVASKAAAAVPTTRGNNNTRGTRRGKGLSVRGTPLLAHPSRWRPVREAELQTTAILDISDTASSRHTTTAIKTELLSPAEQASGIEQPAVGSSAALQQPVQPTKESFKRKLESVLKRVREHHRSELTRSSPETESELSSSEVARSPDTERTGRGSKGGTPKRLKTSQTDAKSKSPVRSVGESSHEPSVPICEGAGVQDVQRPSEGSSTELTRETIASEIRAQVLQSVHSLSSSKGSVRLVLQEGEPYISGVAESPHEVVQISEIVVAGVEGFQGDCTEIVLQEQPSSRLEVLQEHPPRLDEALESVESFPLQAEEPELVAEEIGVLPVGASVVEGGVGGELCGVCGELGPHTCSNRIFSCPDCNKSFSSRFKLSRHQLIHGGERHYHCEICDRSFHRKDHLKNHLQIHEPTKQFKCERPECGKEYNSYMSYRKHCAFHSAEEGDLQCKFCYKMFDNKNDLIYHLKVHVGTRSVKNPSEKKFQCDQCDRRFFTRKDVKRHLVVHTGTRDFCCSLCPQKFGRKDHLVRHIKKSHGVNDLSRLETLADPLAVPGPSGVAGLSAPLSPGLSSLSTSSGDTSGISPYLLTHSPPPHHASLAPGSPSPSQDRGLVFPSYQDVAGSSYIGFAPDPSDLRHLGAESIKEEPEMTPSMTGLGPDLSNILGLYLPSSDGINMTGLMETSSSSQSIGAASQQQCLEDAPSLQPPPPYSAPHYLSPLHQAHHSFSSPHTSPRQQQEDDRMLISASTDSSTAPTTTTTTTSSTSSSHLLPGFDQAFP